MRPSAIISVHACLRGLMPVQDACLSVRMTACLHCGNVCIVFVCCCVHSHVTGWLRVCVSVRACVCLCFCVSKCDCVVTVRLRAYVYVLVCWRIGLFVWATSLLAHACASPCLQACTRERVRMWGCLCACASAFFCVGMCTGIGFSASMPACLRARSCTCVLRTTVLVLACICANLCASACHYACTGERPCMSCVRESARNSVCEYVSLHVPAACLCVFRVSRAAACACHCVCLHVFLSVRAFLRVRTFKSTYMYICICLCAYFWACVCPRVSTREIACLSWCLSMRLYECSYCYIFSLPVHVCVTVYHYVSECLCVVLRLSVRVFSGCLLLCFVCLGMCVYTCLHVCLCRVCVCAFARVFLSAYVAVL
jgi:hypothetical protein